MIVAESNSGKFPSSPAAARRIGSHIFFESSLFVSCDFLLLFTSSFSCFSSSAMRFFRFRSDSGVLRDRCCCRGERLSLLRGDLLSLLLGDRVRCRLGDRLRWRILRSSSSYLCLFLERSGDARRVYIHSLGGVGFRLSLPSTFSRYRL